MKSRIFLSFFALVGLFGLIWAVFFFWNPLKEDNVSITFPLDLEEDLGKLVMEDFREKEEGILLEGNLVDSVMGLLLNPVFDQLEYTEQEYHFYVVNDPGQVNAFALPGGHILIYRGLIDFVEHTEQLQCVMLHELGHVYERHIAEALVRELGIAILTSIATGGDLVLVTDITHTVLSNSFGRDAEKEADGFALDIMVRSGIHPHHMATLFRKMSREKMSFPSGLEFLSTHPHNNARVKMAMEYPIPEDFEGLEPVIHIDSLRALLFNN